MLNWDDVRLFLAVARAGGLAGAVTPTELSAPTLGRRIMALELELGVTLFERHRLGYDLTDAGRELMERSIAMEGGAIALERWRMSIDPQPVVKIAAGPWTISHIARNLQALRPSGSLVRIELLTGVNFVDLAKREANLAIRNKRPHQQGLACRKIGVVEFAIYGASSYVNANPCVRSEERYESGDWVALSPLLGGVPSLSWLEQRLARPAGVRCTSVHAVLDAVINGAGLCILPRFIGDTEGRLERVSNDLKELQSTRWLVSHDDDRHNKTLRFIADRLAGLFLESSATTPGVKL